MHINHKNQPCTHTAASKTALVYELTVCAAAVQLGFVSAAYFSACRVCAQRLVGTSRTTRAPSWPPTLAARRWHGSGHLAVLRPLKKEKKSGNRA